MPVLIQVRQYGDVCLEAVHHLEALVEEEDRRRGPRRLRLCFCRGFGGLAEGSQGLLHEGEGERDVLLAGPDGEALDGLRGRHWVDNKKGDH